MKHVVITGSTRGIGLAMAKEFLKAGCQVTLSGRGEKIKPSVAEELQEYQGSYQYVPCDVQKSLLWRRFGIPQFGDLARSTSG